MLLILLFISLCYSTSLKVPFIRSDFSNKQLIPDKIDSNNIVLIFPGFSGIDSNIDMLTDNIIQSDKDNGLDRLCYICDWSSDTNIFCSGDKGLFAANRVTEQLVQIKCHEKINLHLIGISAGAMAASELCNFLKSFDPKKYNIHLTLLDPFTLFRFNTQYGVHTFGITADFCEQYLNTDDPVPFTNKPLIHAYVHDLTHCRAKKEFLTIKCSNETAHSWPLYYYAKNWKHVTDPRNFIPDHFIYKRGNIKYYL